MWSRRNPWSPRHLLVTLFLGLLAGTLLFGCRAFEPEAVIVNRPPQTYIIGSPAETSGAYFHFHVFWYGTDEDGFVERYVWALTDTSLQDYTDDSSGDEEDERFNPALNINHLEIGTWTTRTDTVFDFRINQGSNLSQNMTLHMVAQDDRGAFDRTPARLHFFSNAVGRPRVLFYRDEIAPGNEFANFDTVAFGRPLFLRWTGSTPNIDAYDPVLLAQRDTVPPFDDGLLGYKWRLPAFDDCNQAVEDCWRPRRFNEATGDSFSFFGNVTGLNFLNDNSGSGVFSRRLGAGPFQLLVNTLDVAGVEVQAANRILNIVVNHDPDTYILRSEPDDIYSDPIVYPIYEVFHGPEAGIYSFSEGDTVPDRAYVTFKAYGWDDARDVILSDENQIAFQGQYTARQRRRGSDGFDSFSPTYSPPHQTPEWTASEATAISADTVGFHVGPFEYTVRMRSVDENLTRDGTPDVFSFVGNYPPCVQAVELVNHLTAPTVVYEDPCYDVASFDDVPELQVYASFDPRFTPGDPLHLQRPAGATQDTIWVRPEAGGITFERPLRPDQWTPIQGQLYYYLAYLHGKDHPQEHWPPGQAHQRIKSWRYEVNYQADSNNSIRDGGGNDTIDLLTGFNIQDNNPDPLASDLYILPGTGVWALRVTVGVPQVLMFGGPAAYWANLQTLFQCPPFPSGGTEQEILAWQAIESVRRAYQAFMLTTMQFTPGTIEAQAGDNSSCEFRSATNAYHYFDGLRGPDGARNCNPQGRQWKDLSLFIAWSDVVAKDFNLSLYPLNQPQYVGGQNPPGWIASKGLARNWR
jgi:hypothetical protein